MRYTIGMQERLQKFIASASSHSRRKAEELIAAGKVTVNGVVVKEFGTKIDPAKDVVCVNGEALQPVTLFRYVLLNKPVGYVCSRSQYKDEKTVYSLVPDSRDLVIAGRLDKDSEGLVLMTNDGALVNTLTHPKYEHKKTYGVVTDDTLSETDLELLQRGIQLEEGVARVDDLKRLDQVSVRLTLHQGWNRQLRRMFGALGRNVVRLRRVSFGPYVLDDLPVGKWKDVEAPKSS